MDAVKGQKYFNENSQNLFSIFDYGVFISMLLLSALIGVYFGFISKKKQNNTAEYLLGSKQMGFLPIAASLIASHISATTLLALPAEIYGNGSEYIWSIGSAFLTGLALIYVFLPVFYGLQVTSAFHYLEKRFDRKVRVVASSIFILSGIITMPVVIYVPALALSQTTNINLHLITTFTSIVCIFYTTFGGLKAVVYTDALQLIMMIGGIICVMFLGLNITGGLGEVLRKADEGGRLIFFNMNPSPFVRTSFWTYWIGLSFAWTAKLGVSQCCVQRFLAVPNIDIAKKSVYAFVIGFSLIKFSSVIVGLTVYTRYADCDPIASHRIEKIDQILPLFVMEVASKIPGLPGIFMAGVFSASLSSMSSSLNTIAGSIYEDFIRSHFQKLSEKRASNIMKILVVIVGGIILGLVFVVEKMGQVFRVGFVINGLTIGALSGIFIAGMCSRSINTKGVISGAVGTILFMSVIIIGSQALPKPPPLPISTIGCEFPLNSTISSPIENFSDQIEEIPIIFKLSFMYYVLLGTIVLFLIALPVSYLTGGCEPFDERLLTPLCRSQNWNEKSQNKKKIEKANDSAIYELKAATNDK